MMPVAHGPFSELDNTTMTAEELLHMRIDKTLTLTFLVGVLQVANTA